MKLKDQRKLMAEILGEFCDTMMRPGREKYTTDDIDVECVCACERHSIISQPLLEHTLTYHTLCCTLFLQEVFEKTVHFFQYIHDKDYFHETQRKLLARRLLDIQVEEESERNLISKLKVLSIHSTSLSLSVS